MLENLIKSRVTEHIVHRYINEDFGFDVALVLNRVLKAFLLVERLHLITY